MDIDAFWSLIENARGDGEQSGHVKRVQEALMQCTPDQIVAFDKLMYQLEAESYTWELWGAAYIINGGCSDDGFDYFRGWLILQGKDLFEAAITEPDNLADYPGLEEGAECEDLLYVASNAYEALTGKELPIVARDMPDLGDGCNFDDESQMTKRYPKLTAKYY
jgi:Protein of unknown function (DUF4240)